MRPKPEDRSTPGQGTSCLLSRDFLLPAVPLYSPPSTGVLVHGWYMTATPTSSHSVTKRRPPIPSVMRDAPLSSSIHRRRNRCARRSGTRAALFTGAQVRAEVDRPLHRPHDGRDSRPAGCGLDGRLRRTSMRSAHRRRDDSDTEVTSLALWDALVGTGKHRRSLPSHATTHTTSSLPSPCATGSVRRRSTGSRCRPRRRRSRRRFWSRPPHRDSDRSLRSVRRPC